MNRALYAHMNNKRKMKKKRRKKTEFPCLLFTYRLVVFKNSHFPDGIYISFITDIWYVSFIGIFLILYAFQNPVTNTDFDKHFGGRNNPNCFLSHGYLLTWKKNAIWKI
jgi:hypothetical protein